MPLSVECLHLGRTVDVQEAIRIKTSWRRGQPKPIFLCKECRQVVTPHQSKTGHTPHIEHIKRNPNCSLSNRKRLVKRSLENYQIDDEKAIEGYQVDRKIFAYKRNAGIAELRKKRDEYKCLACGFHLVIGDRHIIEVHHTKPVAKSGEREVHLDELVSLCPTCHRIAHTREDPYSVDEIPINDAWVYPESVS